MLGTPQECAFAAAWRSRISTEDRLDDNALARLWIEQDQYQECRDPRFAEPEAPTPERPSRDPAGIRGMAAP
jgi:hypothetical protein